MPTLEASFARNTRLEKRSASKLSINGRFLSQSLTDVRRSAAELIKAMERLLASDARLRKVVDLGRSDLLHQADQIARRHGLVAFTASCKYSGWNVF
ncbi:hypothetical protein E4K65_41555 [Bradyrhizobium niftali]|uniref:Uncharacterized protein n=1 Tax=Bradyrhizobium niftali TaxID=2560055 RepID=A0A4Y9L4L2_9BRAD|nr:hypothetical protein E4K65_41555 [Bradyrhizobium niftali]